MYKIAVVGDVTIDLLKKMDKTIHLTKDYEEDNWELYFSKSEKLKGGALLLAEMIEKSIEEEDIIFKSKNEEKEEKNRVYKYNEKDLEDKEFLHTIITLNKFKSSTDEKDCPDNKKIYRISHFDGFSYPNEDNDSKKYNLKLMNKKLEEINEDVDIKVIHDHGNYFRHINEEDLEAQLLNNTTNKTIFIHKMRYPLAKENKHDPLKENLWKKILNESKENGKIKKLIIIITADDLRENGLRISRSLSWERTAFDLRNNIEEIREKEPKNENLKNLKKLFNLDNLNLIIRFETDGAILYQNKKVINKDKNIENRYTYSLFFDPEVFEGSIERQYLGNMKSLGIAFVAGLILGIQKYPEKLYEDGIKDGIKKGIIASRKLYETGFKTGTSGENKKKGKMNYPYTDIFKTIDNKTDNIHDVKIEKSEEKNDNKENTDKDKHKEWRIIDQTLKDDDIYQTACQIVKRGKTRNLIAPVAEFGNLSTADRDEIESYHSIKNLINEYLNKKNVSIPLSIAVFGPPGSGKSFGVTEIAKSISEDIEKLEFNLSQFESSKDLFNAFHIVQSTSLKGKIPLVFFDEFDSKLDNEDFGWLKYFLSPMNDGSFKQGDTIHPIGKCIFVFAGGTKKTFLEFEKDKKKAKGSDFVSRLRGYVNIIGINMQSEEIKPQPPKYLTYNGIKYNNRNIITKLSKDNHYMIRRALVLRNLLNKNAPNIFEELGSKKIVQIDDSVLNALIKIPEFKHGNRSMEAIIEMSTLSNRKRFDRSALPSSEQLQLHVDSEKFKEHLNNPEDCQEQIISGKVLKSPWKAYSCIVDKVYNYLSDEGEELEIQFMRTGSRDPDLNFKDFKNHRGDKSYKEVKDWLEKGKDNYENDKDYASYCFGVACHYIIDTFSAPHCVDKAKIEDHRKFELQAEQNRILKNISIKEDETLLQRNVPSKKGEECWDKWNENKASEELQCAIVQKNLDCIASTALTFIKESIPKVKNN